MDINKNGHADGRSFQRLLHHAAQTGGIDCLFVSEQEMEDQGIGSQFQGIAGVDER